MTNKHDLDHGRVITHVDVSVEALAQADVVMEAYTKAIAAQDALIQLLPQNAYVTVYGKGDCVIIRHVPETKEDES